MTKVVGAKDETGNTERMMGTVSDRLCPARVTGSGATVAARTVACGSGRGWNAGAGHLQTERENLMSR